jgi:DHA1 family multidrug resistance protein-like MFS transporter
LILIAFALMTWGLGEGMFYFFQPLYLQDLGADPLKIGAILGLVGLATMLSYLPAGYLSDRIGRRPLIFLAWIIGAIATGLMALAQSLPMFVGGMVLYGLTGFVTVPLNSYTTHARGKWSIGRTITLISASFYSGFILGPLIGGWVGENISLHANFTIAAVIFVISSTIILFIRPQPVESGADGDKLTVLRSLWSGRYAHYMLLTFFVMFGLYLPQPLTPNYLQNLHGISLVVMGQLISMRSLGVVIFSIILGHFNARLGYLLAQVCMGLFAALIWLGAGLPAYMAGYLLMGSYITARGLVIAQGRTLVHAPNMGIAYGSLETVMSLAIVLGSPLAGYLYSLNPNWIYPTSLALIGAGLVANLVLSPLRRRDQAKFEEREKDNGRNLELGH